MKSEKIIKKITIDIAGTEVEVTPQQAKNLHEALSELLGLDKPEAVKHIHHYDRWYWPYTSPYYYSNSSSGMKLTSGASSGNFNMSFTATNGTAKINV